MDIGRAISLRSALCRRALPVLEQAARRPSAQAQRQHGWLRRTGVGESRCRVEHRHVEEEGERGCISHSSQKPSAPLKPGRWAPASSQAIRPALLEPRVEAVLRVARTTPAPRAPSIPAPERTQLFEHQRKDQREEGRVETSWHQRHPSRKRVHRSGKITRQALNGTRGAGGTGCASGFLVSRRYSDIRIPAVAPR